VNVEPIPAPNAENGAAEPPAEAGGKPELRLAVVMNGGVSLAVWMAGATVELDRLRRSGALAGPGPASAAWADVIAASPFNRVVVDVVAGTSAGGINGVLLATAVARGSGIVTDKYRNLWRDAAQLTTNSLLRATPQPGSSLLDGDFFKKKISDALSLESAIVPVVPGVTKLDDDEIQLRVTATGLGPQTISRTVGNGSEVKVQDGRRVFSFRAEDFRNEEGVADLVRSARASASFPVAFAPVETLPTMVARETSGRSVVGEPLVDGGVMDNAPFEPTLDALSHRRATRPFKRTVLYVKPGVEAQPGRPGSFSQLVNLPGALTNTMRQPDARLDFDRLGSQFERMQFSVSQPASLLRRALKGVVDGEQLIAAAENLFPTYKEGKLQTLGVPEPVPWSPPQAPDPNLTTLAPWIDVAVPEAFAYPFPAGEWKWGTGTAERILTWFARAANEHDGNYTLRADAMEACAVGIKKVRAVIASYQVALGKIENPTPAEASGELVTAGVLGLTAVLEAAAGAVAAAITPAEAPLAAGTVMKLALSIEVLAAAFNWSGSEADIDPPVFSYHELTPAAIANALLVGAGAQVQPVAVDQDAFLANWPAKKLYGERLGHFGAFTHADCRKHDFLWGRLDAASSLGKLLLADADIVAEQKEILINAVRKEILAEEFSELQSDEAQIEALRIGAAAVYSATSKTMIDKMKSEWSKADRAAVADLVMALPAANLDSKLDSSSLVRTALGLPREVSWPASVVDRLVFRPASGAARWVLRRQLNRKLRSNS
jgi:predicted acylesterase/phospholipase RssA